jgi:hypothetical protein
LRACDGPRLTRWLEIPLGADSGRKAPTWNLLAERYDRCFRRVEFYVGPRVRDPETFERIVNEVIDLNLDLLVSETDELEEIRRLRATADRLIALRVGLRQRIRRSRP